MTGLSSLWLPIFLSAVAVFLASSVIHMVSAWHKGDYKQVPNQDKFMDTVRPLAIPPGDYMVPRPSSRQDMRSPEFDEKFKKGPVMVMTVMPSGKWSMAQPLILWFLYALVVGLFAAAIAGCALPHYILMPDHGDRAEHARVFHITGLTAFVGYSLALWQMSIWYRRSWSTTIKATVDGAIYALLTASIFGWLWPK